MSCFLTYLAIGTSDPITQERLAYAVLIIREAMRHGGQGWLEYDRLFRQQAALNPTLPWNVIHPELQALIDYPWAAASQLGDVLYFLPRFGPCM